MEARRGEIRAAELDAQHESPARSAAQGDALGLPTRGLVLGQRLPPPPGWSWSAEAMAPPSRRLPPQNCLSFVWAAAHREAGTDQQCARRARG